MDSASHMLVKPDAPSAADTLGAGSVMLTKKLRIKYGKEDADAQVNDTSAPPWAEWLGQQGYALDRQGLVYKSGK